MTATPTRSWLARPTKAEGGGQTRRVAELAGSPKLIDAEPSRKEVQAQILLVHEELEIEAVEATVDVPVGR